MRPSNDSISLKRKQRTVSTFLKKTYELLQVHLYLFRIKKIWRLLDGHPMALVSLLPTKKSFPNLYSLITLSTAIIPPLLGNSTCIISIKFGRAMERVISIMKTLTASINRSQLRSSENLRKRKEEMMKQTHKPTVIMRKKTQQIMAQLKVKMSKKHPFLTRMSLI